MRRALALVQLAGLAVALGAMLAPAPRTLLEKWSSVTIYPAWTPVALGLGVAAAVLSVVAPAAAARATAFAAGVTGVCAVQVGALGLWAQKHWLPAFGMGGGYAGDVPELERWAWIVAGAGALAAAAALGQLVVQHDWPRPVDLTARRWRVGLGVAVMVGVPALLATGHSDLRDLTSLAAYALVFGVPWGLSLVAAGWLSGHGTLGVLAASTVGAALSAIRPSSDLTYREGGGFFALAAVLLGVLLVVEVRRPSAPAATGSARRPGAHRAVAGTSGAGRHSRSPA